MRGYFTGALTAAVIASLAMMLCEGGEHEKYIKYISGLVSVIIIAEPLVNILKSGRELDFSFDMAWETAETYDYDAEVIENAERILEEEITSEISRRFRVSKEYISVEVVLDPDNMSDVVIEKISVTLYEYGAYADSDGIRRYLSRVYDCEALVEYE